MPFELGLGLGCKAYWPRKLAEKKCLILEKEQYGYQQTLSDISGNDIKSHYGSPEMLVRKVRDWIFETTNTKATSTTRIWRRFNEFYCDFMMAVNKSGYSETEVQEMPIIEFITFIKEWKTTELS